MSTYVNTLLSSTATCSLSTECTGTASGYELTYVVAGDQDVFLALKTLWL